MNRSRISLKSAANAMASEVPSICMRPGRGKSARHGFRRRTLLAAVAPLAAAASLTGCSWSSLLNAAAPKQGIQRRRDIAYGPDPRHRLDYYYASQSLNESGRSRGVIMFFHGGSWRSGSKDDYAFVGYRLAQEGFEAIIANYRLVPEIRFPVFVEDAAQVVAWTADNSESPVSGRDDLFVMGHSAGAHIAAMAALDARFLAVHGLDPAIRLKGWIGLSGPYDFLPFSSRSVAEVFEVGDPGESQPINFVDAGRTGPPALIITGNDDTTVLPRNSRNLARAIQQAGGQAQLISYDTVGHAGTLLAFGPSITSSAPVLRDLNRFVDQRVGLG